MAKKKVLFIGIGFYDYEDSIISEFKRLDYDVDYFCEVPDNTIAFRFYSRIKNINKISQFIEFHNFKIANESGSNYDLVFIIKCENISKDTLITIREKNPNSLFVLYLWDSLQRIKNVESKFFAFNKVFSFDRLDCINNKTLIFNPLFCRDEYHIPSNQEKYLYDIYHLGWYHSDRLSLIRKIASICKKNNLKHKFLLYTGFFSFLAKFILGGELRFGLNYLVFKPISTIVNRNLILKSKVVLDIAHPNQSGLTMRTIELVGMQKKIVTTNQDIINYDFYHPNNIYVIDRGFPFIDKSFINLDYMPIEFDLINKYSLSQWLVRMI
jgi:hypothetical protein